MSKIKRCPFCGGEINFDGYVGDEYVCETCDLWGISLEWWNTRPIEDTLRAERDELLKTLSEIVAYQDRAQTDLEWVMIRWARRAIPTLSEVKP